MQTDTTTTKTTETQCPKCSSTLQDFSVNFNCKMLMCENVKVWKKIHFIFLFSSLYIQMRSRSMLDLTVSFFIINIIDSSVHTHLINLQQTHLSSKITLYPKMKNRIKKNTYDHTNLHLV